MRVLRGARRHPILTAVLVAALAASGWGLHWWYWPSVPTANPDRVAAVEVRLAATPGEPAVGNGQDEFRVETSDRDHILALLSVFARAERASEHKCGSCGTITIRRTDGAAEVLELLPGHDPIYYEYRYAGRINRVDRAVLLIALRGLGVGRIKLESP